MRRTDWVSHLALAPAEFAAFAGSDVGAQFLRFKSGNWTVLYNTPILLDMGARMKTTIEVSDALFKSAKGLAQQRQTTLRALVEEGLRRVLSDSQAKAKPAFKLKDARVRGKEILIADPRRWQELEDGHVAARVNRPET